MENENTLKNLEKNKVRIDHIHYIFGVLSILTFVLTVILGRNPDTDSYFLIDNGRYIIENKCVPTQNVWTIHEGLSIVIQQWICSVLNYLAYSIGGWYGIKVLAVLNTLLFNVVLYKYICEYTNSKKIKIILLCAMNLTLCLFFTTRPYPITMSAIVYELTLLHRLYKQKESNKSICIKLCAISLFVINYQSASWYFVFIVMLPYIVPWIFIRRKDSNKLYLIAPSDEEYDNLRNKEKNTRRILLRTIPLMLCLGFVNPNGINGIKYLWNSYSSVTSGGNIEEMMSPSYKSVAGVIIVVYFVLYMIYILKNEDKEKPLVYLATGMMLLAMMSGRNNWMLVSGFVPFIVFILNKYIADDKYAMAFRSTRGIRICEYLLAYIIVLSVSLGVLSACNQNMDTYDRVEMVEYLNTFNKDEIVLYTDFNTGAYFEFNGFKTYIDARPELYQKVINGKADIYTEYLDMLKQNTDTEEFLNKYKFTHLVVQRPCILDEYLYYNSNYTMILEDDNCRLYERNYRE